jgi:hypothetical protein
MLSHHHISKGTAVALAVGAFAAPVASAEPFGGIPSQDKPLSPSTQSRHVSAADQFARRAGSWQSRSIAGYSRQDKQLSASAQSAPAAPLAGYSRQISPRPVLPASATPGAAAFYAVSSPGSPAVARATSPGDGVYAGIGAAGVLAIVAIGGGLVLVERRPRRTKTTAVATG